jgi:8-oxo-dGTP diphosphatase
VILGYRKGQLYILLRKEEVRNGSDTVHMHKLPGNHMGATETVEETAKRILKEQAGAENIFMKQFQVFSAPDRLYRSRMDKLWLDGLNKKMKRVVTVGFYSLIKLSDRNLTRISDRAAWVNIREVKELLLDHYDIFKQALERIRTDALYLPIIYELLPKKFSMSELQSLCELIHNKQYDRRNFRRQIMTTGYIVDLNEKQTNAGHKPSALYTFNRRNFIKQHR